MLYRIAALAAVLLVAPLGFSAAEEDRSQLTLNSLKPGQAFEVQTADRYFRCQIVDPRTGEAKVSASWDGKDFGPQRHVYVLGSTAGKQARSGGFSLVFMNDIKEGLRMELGMGSLEQVDRRLTGPVTAIRMLPDSATVAQL